MARAFIGFVFAAFLISVSNAPAASDPLSGGCFSSSEQVGLYSPISEMVLAQNTLTTKPGGGDTRPGGLVAPSSGTPTARLIKKGGCCAEVNGGCATICDREGGCTGVGDCITNPN